MQTCGHVLGVLGLRYQPAILFEQEKYIYTIRQYSLPWDI